MTNAELGDWQAHLIEDEAGISRVIDEARCIAVLGIKTDPRQPAYYVPEYTQRAGFEVIPVPDLLS